MVAKARGTAALGPPRADREGDRGPAARFPRLQLHQRARRSTRRWQSLRWRWRPRTAPRPRRRGRPRRPCSIAPTTPASSDASASARLRRGDVVGAIEVTERATAHRGARRDVADERDASSATFSGRDAIPGVVVGVTAARQRDASSRYRSTAGASSTPATSSSAS